MNQPHPLRDHGDSERTAVALPESSAPEERTPSGMLTRLLCGGVLLIAVALGAHELLIDPALRILHGWRWIYALRIEFELLLAAWLLSGLNGAWCRRISIVTFL